MNVLYLTLSNFTNFPAGDLYHDTVQALTNNGCNVYVVSALEKRVKREPIKKSKNKVTICEVRTGNITKNKSKIDKGIALIRLQRQFDKLIGEELGEVEFSFVLIATPPITFNNIIKKFSRRGIPTYLMLKDIFPQNAVDLNMLSKKSLIYKYFRQQEKGLYNLVDYIGCMSPANADYIKKHNDINDEKVEIFPNSIKINNRLEVLEKSDESQNKTLFLYGGNLGKPQDISFIKKVVDAFENRDTMHLMIIGDGTEFAELERYIKNKSNTTLKKRLPKKEYDKVLIKADVGLIFLDHRFTIPNIPSRLNSYLENSIPVLAATDTATDLKDIIEKSECGFWTSSSNIEQFMDYADNLSQNSQLREKFGKNGRKLLEKEFDIDKNIKIILKHFENGGS